MATCAELKPGWRCGECGSELVLWDGDPRDIHNYACLDCPLPISLPGRGPPPTDPEADTVWLAVFCR